MIFIKYNQYEEKEEEAFFGLFTLVKEKKLYLIIYKYIKNYNIINIEFFVRKSSQLLNNVQSLRIFAFHCMNFCYYNYVSLINK